MRTTNGASPPDSPPRAQVRLPETGRDRPPLFGPVDLLFISAFVLFVVVHFFGSNWSWFRPFLRDFWRWIRDPRVTGGWQAPTRPLLAVAIFAIAGILGWLAARLLLRGTAFAAERTLAGGLAITLGVCVIGYGGMLGVVFGLLSAQALLAFYALVAAVLGGLTIRTRRRERGDVVDEDRTRPAPRPLKVLTAAFAALVLALTLSHAALAPVQEWDAIVYHAENAKLWFQERPAPPVIYGPSVGIEISANYPPLFSASGAAIYTLLGRFDDLYLRVLPPLLFLSILLMTYGYARRRFGEDTACYATLLLLGTPLMLFYGVWTTGYILMAALVLATVVLSDMAAQAGSPARWAIAGAVAGLALLSHFYGVVAIPAGLAAIVIHRRRGWLGPALFLAVALAVASPWLLRNLILLHDPFYPLGSPPFHGKGLVQPLWEASKTEIKRNAVAQYGTSPRVWGLKTALFDSNLLPVSLYFGLLLGLALWWRQRVMSYLAMALLAVLLVLVTPGWYWLRGLLPGLPIAALLTGRAVVVVLEAARDARRASRFLGKVARLSTAFAVVVSVLASGAVGLGLAIAGPNQMARTTALSSGNDLMRAVEDFGSERQTLWNVFSGDALLWQWINRNVPAGSRVATLENQIYYLDRPQDLFYLDGLEAVPLLHSRAVQRIQRFLLARRVRYVVLPSWTVTGTGRFPIVGIMPLFRFLGTSWFPAVATFPVESGGPSVVYSVGPTKMTPTIGVYPGAGWPEPSLVNPAVTIRARDVDPRIFIPLSEAAPATLEFEYGSGRGAFYLNLYDPSTERWQYAYYQGLRTGQPGWETAVVPLPSARAFVDFGVYVEGTPLRIRDLRVVPVSVPQVYGMREIVLRGRGRGYVVAPGDSQGSIWVPVGGSGRATLAFRYLDATRGSFDASVRAPSGRWVTATSLRLRHTGRWRMVRIQVFATRPGFVQVKLSAHGAKLRIRDLRRLAS